jgi:hypothetical protein
MVTLIVIDHHHSDFVDKDKVEIPTFATEEEFIEYLEPFLQRDYDLLLSDADPDGYLSATLYCLNKGIEEPNYKCFRVPITKEHLQIYEKNGVQSIIAFDWFPLYGTDASLFDRVILLNPRYSKLFENTSSTELVYRASANKTTFMKDLNAIGVVSDYGMTSGMNTVLDTIARYPVLLNDIKTLADENKINRYNVFQSKFAALSEMYWAPYIIDGEEGANELVRCLTSAQPFTYWDLFNYAHHPAIEYLRKMYHKYQRMEQEELARYQTHKKEVGNVIIYEPKSSSPGFIQKFSSNLCNDIRGKVFLLKIKINGRTKYSGRQHGLLIDLGKIFEELGIGGGHPQASGGMTDDPEGFESAFIERVKTELAI